MNSIRTTPGDECENSDAHEGNEVGSEGEENDDIGEDEENETSIEDYDKR